MRIGDLARQAGCTVEAVRYYEREGLLPRPERGANNYRMYDASHLESLRFVRNCRALEMSLGEIRTLLQLKLDPDGDCGEVNDILEGHIGHVTERIARLEGLHRQLLALRGMCGRTRPTKSCAILMELADAQEPAAAGPSARPCVPGAHGGSPGHRGDL